MRARAIAWQWFGVPGGVWLFALFFAVVTSLPALAGYLNAPPGGAFTGNPLEETCVDFNSQLARMWTGYEGGWLHHDRFTPEDHPPVIMQPLYALLGHVARLTGLPLDLAYNLGRFALSLALVLVIWTFAARFFADNRMRWTVLLLATVVGDLGWLLYFIAPEQAAQIAPLEFWLLDAYPFTVALSFPHLAGGVIVLLGFLLLFDRWLATPTWRGVGWLSLLSLIAGGFMPYMLLATALVVAVLALSFWRLRRLTLAQVLMLAPAAAAHVAVVGYYALALNSDPVWAVFTAQNLTLSPPPVYYLLGYAWLLIPAVVGVVYMWRSRAGRWLLPLLWVAIIMPLLYAPLPTQRRYLLGAQVPLAVLAAVGLDRARAWWLARRWALARWRLIMAALLVFSALLPVLVLVRALAQPDPAANPDLFLSADEISALEWLAEQPPETVVFSTFPSGGQIVAFSGRRVYIGHWIETPEFDRRQAQVAAFFGAPEATMTDAARLALLREHGIDYLWVDDSARALGDWSPEGVAWLDAALITATVTIYEVLP